MMCMHVISPAGRCCKRGILWHCIESWWGTYDNSFTHVSFRRENPRSVSRCTTRVIRLHVPLVRPPAVAIARHRALNCPPGDCHFCNHRELQLNPKWSSLSYAVPMREALDLKLWNPAGTRFYGLVYQFWPPGYPSGFSVLWADVMGMDFTSYQTRKLTGEE